MNGNNQGFSLTELIIAITLSFILLGGVLQLFFNSKRIYLLSNAYSQLQENGRFITEYLSRNIRLSGYRSTPTNTQFEAQSSIFSNAAPYISVNAAPGINGSDILTIRYQGSGNGAGTPDGTIRDCLNRPVDANVIATNIFSINANYELQCQALNTSASTNNATDILVEGLENIKILFGEDLDGDLSADRYVSPNYAGINLANIVSARVSLLLRSTNDVKGTASTKAYSLAGSNFTPVADKKIRQLFSFSVQLRNPPTST